MKVSIEFKKGNEGILPSLVKLLYEENSKLLNRINELKTELENGLVKVFFYRFHRL